MLVTEEDYFRFLVRMAVANSHCPPSVLNDPLQQSDLLFLGFRLDDLAFRTFVELFLQLESVRNRPRNKGFDVAVQLDPRDIAAASAAQVQEYVERLFARQDDDMDLRVNIRIYWQGLPTFLDELYDRWPIT